MPRHLLVTHMNQTVQRLYGAIPFAEGRREERQPRWSGQALGATALLALAFVALAGVALYNVSGATVLLAGETAPTAPTSAVTNFNDLEDLEEVKEPTSNTFAAMRPDENKFLAMLGIDATRVGDTDLVRV